MSGRKGPEVSATAYAVGTIRKGNDGNKWVIRETKAGVKRWVRVPLRSESKKRTTAQQETTRTISFPSLKREGYKFVKKGTITSVAHCLYFGEYVVYLGGTTTHPDTLLVMPKGTRQSELKEFEITNEGIGCDGYGDGYFPIYRSGDAFLVGGAAKSAQ